MNDSSPHALSPYATARRAESVGASRWALMLGPLLITGAAFGVFLLSSLYLEARDGIAYFGADSDHYSTMEHLATHHRAARFHPATIVLGLAWMELLSPLTAWIAPQVLLKAMFAAAGAAGVLAAIWAFAALLPRDYALLGGILYGNSLGVWYFSAIPESKILTATLATLYIAAYIRYRQHWTLPRSIGLTTILAVACLNEIVSGFLIAIPAVDFLLQRSLDWRRVRWLVAHVLVALVAWFVLEVFVNGWLIPESQSPEHQSHLALLLHYIAANNYGLATIHDFFANWFFFNLVAPTPHALWWSELGGYFQPSLVAYLWSPLAVAALLVIAVMVAASLLPRTRAASLGPAGSLLLPLAAYALIRAVFFFIFNPGEALLFSSAVTLPHWLILLVPFAASRFPAKRALLAVLCVLLFATNASFMAGPDGWSGLAMRLDMK